MKKKQNYYLIERIERVLRWTHQLFPINHRTKYPIFFGKLLERINSLKNRFNKFNIIKVYLNVELNKKTINLDLKNKGGIYLWWCKTTGFFYVGSAGSNFCR